VAFLCAIPACSLPPASSLVRHPPKNSRIKIQEQGGTLKEAEPKQARIAQGKKPGRAAKCALLHAGGAAGNHIAA